jgi:hypothetical protein
MAMTLVSTVTVGSGGAASILFDNIPQSGKDLLLLISARRADNSGIISLQFNGDTAANYSNNRRLRGDGSGVSSTDFSNENYSLHQAASNSTFTANTFGSGSIYISNYTSSVAKVTSSDGVSENNSTSADQMIWAGRWTGTSAISSITVGTYGGGNMEQYSTASLYIVS